MRSAIIFLSIFTANVLAAPLNLCLGADGQGHICKREDGPDTTLNRREPINICLGADGQGYWFRVVGKLFWGFKELRTGDTEDTEVESNYTE
ncbi:hypothetical protein MCOR25_009741 [Pyricularia grisea]|nr:hypothetical protein MCOR25_009741 [Pyricularia grisea]